MQANLPIRVVCSLDLGRSGLKAVWSFDNNPQQELFIESVVTPKRYDLSDPAAALAADADTVWLGNAAYWVGKTAIAQGGAVEVAGLDRNWITTSEHWLLVKAALKRITKITHIQPNQMGLVFGLPSQEYASQKAKLTELAEKHTKCHSVMVVPQAMGPYIDTVLDFNGTLKPGFNMGESWGVIDIGRFTTDFLFIKDGAIIESSLTSCGGIAGAVKDLAATLRNEYDVEFTSLAADSIMTRGNFVAFGETIDASVHVKKALDAFAFALVPFAKSAFSRDAYTMRHIIIAGGPASLIGDKLKDELKWKNIIVAPEPRFAIARGYYKSALRRFKSNPSPTRPNKAASPANV